MTVSPGILIVTLQLSHHLRHETVGPFALMITQSAVFNYTTENKQEVPA